MWITQWNIYIYTHTQTHTMECHSALKRKNFLTRATNG